MPTLRAYLKPIEIRTARQLSHRAPVRPYLGLMNSTRISVPEPQCEGDAISDATLDVCGRLGGALL